MTSEKYDKQMIFDHLKPIILENGTSIRNTFVLTNQHYAKDSDKNELLQVKQFVYDSRRRKVLYKRRVPNFSSKDKNPEGINHGTTDIDEYVAELFSTGDRCAFAYTSTHFINEENLPEDFTSKIYDYYFQNLGEFKAGFIYEINKGSNMSFLRDLTFNDLRNFESPRYFTKFGLFNEGTDLNAENLEELKANTTNKKFLTNILEKKLGSIADETHEAKLAEIKGDSIDVLSIFLSKNSKRENFLTFILHETKSNAISQLTLKHDSDNKKFIFSSLSDLKKPEGDDIGSEISDLKFTLSHLNYLQFTEFKGLESLHKIVEDADGFLKFEKVVDSESNEITEDISGWALDDKTNTLNKIWMAPGKENFEKKCMYLKKITLSK